MPTIATRWLGGIEVPAESTGGSGGRGRLWLCGPCGGGDALSMWKPSDIIATQPERCGKAGWLGATT